MTAASPILEHIVDQHFDEAAFLWEQRDAAVTAINYSLEDLAYLDSRVDAHIDGLRLAGEYGWKLCEDGLDEEEPGTAFATSVIAMESGDAERIDQVIDAGNQSRAAFRAVVSGLGWMNNKRFKERIPELVRAKSRKYRRLGVAACGIRRINPRQYLDQAVESSDLYLKARALRAAGELKRLDLLPAIKLNIQREDHACRFAAARSALLLGDRSALEALSAFVLTQSSYTLPAMRIALRLVDAQTARNWLKAQAKVPEQRRQMLIGTGITGEPGYIPMLIKQMSNPEYARAAGESFEMITGIDLAAEKLEQEPPQGFKAGPNDDTDNDDVAMDEDEDLNWPDADLVSRWWEQNAAAFQTGNRYLAGHPITPETCRQVLKNGNQRQRHAAALELALSSPEAPYFNIRGPGAWQKKRL
ncbi:MAG: TIGR02270 family protein [Gammaproteobacteria bacterium]|nr:TIGR02270 family protein [Gammaproteobacteria bacterium]